MLLISALLTNCCVHGHQNKLILVKDIVSFVLKHRCLQVLCSKYFRNNMWYISSISISIFPKTPERVGCLTCPLLLQRPYFHEIFEEF
jgi:hypothetical protein